MSIATAGICRYPKAHTYTIYKAGWAAANSILDHDVARSKRTYCYGADAAVPFGFGLSLTDWKLRFESGIPPPLITLDTANSVVVNVSLTVTNSGSISGDSVIQAYFLPTAVPGLTLFPQKSLFDFSRVSDVPAGGSASVVFSVSADSLLLATAAGDLVREPGSYTLEFHDGTGMQVPLRARLSVAGTRAVAVTFPTVADDGQ
jgi:hypothetical protein